MIRLDRRVGSRHLLGPLQRLGAPTKLATLPSGDVSFRGFGPDGWQRIGMELKTLSDLLGSVESGRLTAHQIPAMLGRYATSYLIVEGAWRPDADGLVTVPRKQGRRFVWVPFGHGGRRWTYATVQRILNSVSLQAGVRWLRSSSTMETAFIIWSLYNWWQDEWDQHATFKAFHHRPPPRAQLVRPSVLRTIAADIPQIGWEYSAAVEAAFGSVRAMTRAGVEQWASLRRDGLTTDGKRRPRLGLKKARQVVALLRGE